MKYIVHQHRAAITVAASSTDPLYPAANLLKATQRLRWAAASSAVTSATLSGTLQDATLPLPPPPGVGATADTTYTGVVVSGVFAATVTIDVFEAGNWPVMISPPGLETKVFTDPMTGAKTWWFTFAEQPGSTAGGFVLTLSKASGSTISASNIFVGHSRALTGVRYPMSEGLIDTSVVIQLADGSLYAKYRPSLRTFDCEAMETIAVASQFLRDAAKIGGHTAAWHLAPNLTDDFYVQAQFDRSMPVATHAGPNISMIRFNLREVI